MTRTPTQAVVLNDYRDERRHADRFPVEAASAVRDSYARQIARVLAEGHTPTRPMIDRFRVAEQWVVTVVQRDIVRLGRLGRAS